MPYRLRRTLDCCGARACAKGTAARTYKSGRELRTTLLNEHCKIAEGPLLHPSAVGAVHPDLDSDYLGGGPAHAGHDRRIIRSSRSPLPVLTLKYPIACDIVTPSWEGLTIGLIEDTVDAAGEMPRCLVAEVSRDERAAILKRKLSGAQKPVHIQR